MSLTTLITVERARSGRSKCASSQEPIALGEMRVGIMSWRMGRSCVAWQKASSFATTGLFCELAKTGAASCKVTGEKQPKGTLRFGVRTGSNTAFYLGVDAGAPMIRQALCAADAKPIDIQGVAELADEQRQIILKSCAPSEKEREDFAREHAALDGAQQGSAGGVKKLKKRKRDPQAESPDVRA